MANSNVAQCEICCLVRPSSEMDRGDCGYYCGDDPECRQPLTHPRQRKVATLTTEILDDLEWIADGSDDACTLADVPPAVLRALIDAARRDLRRDADSIYPTGVDGCEDDLTTGEAGLCAGCGLVWCRDECPEFLSGKVSKK